MLPAVGRLSRMAQTAQPVVPARRVVVAEDEALIRLDLVEMLSEEGYDVVGEAGDEIGRASCRERVLQVV